jgi:hypothetical protein
MFTEWQKREWKAKACVKCGATQRLELDHIVPRFAGGTATPDNAQTLCGKCNREKFWGADFALYLELLKQRAIQAMDTSPPQTLSDVQQRRARLPRPRLSQSPTSLKQNPIRRPR